MNLKYMKVSLFEISYKIKINFFTIFIFLDVPVYIYIHIYRSVILIRIPQLSTQKIEIIIQYNKTILY